MLTAPYLPQPISDLEAAFPANAYDLMPDLAEIPEDFWRNRGEARPWVKFQQTWFFKGLRGVKVEAKSGIDYRAAVRHLRAIQESFEPKHEHKEAAVAYLASLWLEPVDLDGAA